MELYLLRHGIAEEHRAGAPDSARALTTEGRKKLAGVMEMARATGAAPSLLLSSPYVRAMETARIAATELGYKGAIIEAKCLTPDGSPHDVWSEVRENRHESGILLTSHEPLLSKLAAYVLGCPALLVEMKKSALLRIDVDAARNIPYGILRWMLVPVVAQL